MTGDSTLKGLDVEALVRWLDSEGLPGLGEDLDIRFVSGGSQNEIFEIRRGDFHCAIRKPPTNAPVSRDEGILREWRIIEALGGTDTPHARAIAVCSDDSVLGRPFYLMDFVDGWSPMNNPVPPPPFDQDPVARAGLAYQLIEGIVQMGKVDWKAKGLAGLGRPEGYHDRQVERWTRFLGRVQTREIPGLAEATAWLRDHRPLDFVPGIMHGDYQFANVMFGYATPARLAAIVDWEMGTIGDPKLDLAWALQGWPEDTVQEESAISYIDIAGMPGRSELLSFYSESSGRQVDDFDYYAILARWKLAIVLEQGYERAGDDEHLIGFGPKVLELMERAADLAESTTYKGPQ